MEQDMAAKRRKDMKEFLKMKRNQAKNLKEAGGTVDQAREALQKDNVEQFSQIFNGMTPESAFTFLFSEDELKSTPMMIVFEKEHWLQFIEAINKWSATNFTTIEAQLKQAEESEFKKSLLSKNFWKTHQQLVRAQVKRQQTTNRQKIVQLFSEKLSLYSCLFMNFFTFCNLLTFVSENKMDEILSDIYLPLCEKLDHPEKQVVSRYLTMIRKQSTWNSQSFQERLKDTEVLTLKVINYNFLHELSENKKYEEILLIIDKLEGQQPDLLEQYFNCFNQSGATPLDIMLCKWDYDPLSKIFAKISKIEEIHLSVNCLNFILKNYNLKKEQIEEFINQMLEGLISEHGYCQRVKIDKPKGIDKKKKFNIVDNNTSYIITTDQSKVVKSIGKFQTYPLLGYLQRFTQSPNLLTLQKLIFKGIERKTFKKFYFSAIMQFGSDPHYSKQSQGFKECESYEVYLNPLMEIICKIEQEQVLNYLVDKFLINYMFMTTHRETDRCVLRLINQHFIFYYARIHKDLSESELNKKIVEKVTDLQQFSKISDRYNHVVKLSEWIEKSEQFKKSQEWLPTQIRQFVNQKLPQFKKQQEQEPEEEEEHLPSYISELYHLQTASTAYKSRKTNENLEKYLAQEKKARQAQINGYKTYIQPNYIYIGQPDAESNIDTFFKYEQNFNLSVVRKFSEQNQQTYKNFISNLSNPCWKTIVSIMYERKTKSKSMDFITACLSCKNDDVDLIYNLISSNPDKKIFIENLKRAISYRNPINGFLIHKLKQLDDFKNFQEIDKALQYYFYHVKDFTTKQQKENVTANLIKMMIEFLPSEKGIGYISLLGKMYPFFEIQSVFRQVGFDRIADRALENQNLTLLQYAVLTTEQPVECYLKAVQMVENKIKQQEHERNSKDQEQKDQVIIMDHYNLIETPANDRNHESKKVLEKFIQKMSAQQILKFMEETKAIKSKETLVMLLEMEISEEKKIMLLQDYHQKNGLYLETKDFKRITANPQLSMFTPAAFAYYLKPNFSIFLYVRQEYNIVTFQDKHYLSSCKDLSFETFIKHLKNVTHSDLEPHGDYIQKKLSSSFVDLFEKQKWNRIKMLLDISNPKKFDSVICTGFDYFAKNLLTFIECYLSEQRDKLVNYFFEVLQKQIEKHNQNLQLFINAFLINPDKSLEIFELSNRTLFCWTKCLHYHPEVAAKVYEKSIKLRCEFPSAYKEIKPFYPMSNYSIYDLTEQQYLIDLMKCEIHFKKQWDQGIDGSDQAKQKCYDDYSKALKSKKIALFMTKQAQARYSQIYSPDQLKQFSYLIFSNYSLTSLKDIPKSYLDAYVQKNGSVIKNVQLLQTSVIKQLIDEGYVKKQEFWDIVRSCRMEVLEYYLQKLGISVDKELVRSLEKEDKSRNLLERLCQIDNEKFVLEFIEKYEIFNKFGEQLCQKPILSRLLVNIALHKRVGFLQKLLQALENTRKDITFLIIDEQEKCGFGEQSKLYLPKAVTESNHFYEYYFLLKQSHNHHALNFQDLNFQERFIFADENQCYEQYNFLPEMKRRLIFLNKVSRIVPQGLDGTIFRNKLLPSILLNQYIKNFQFFREAMNGKINCEAIISQAPKSHEEIYAKLYIFMKAPQLMIPGSIIEAQYPHEYKVVKKTMELAEIQLENVEPFYAYSSKQREFQDIILQTNPEFFFKNIQHEEFLKNSMEYMEGFVAALIYFQAEDNIPFTKQYCDNCFFENQELKPGSDAYGEFRLKYLLIACLISQFEGKGAIISYVAQKMGIENHEQLLLTLAGFFVHKKSGVNIGMFWDKVQDNIRQISMGKFNNKGNYKIICNSSFKNACEILESTLADTPDIYKFLAVNRIVSYLQSQSQLLKEQITDDNVEFHLGESFSCEKSQEKVLYRIPFELIKDNEKTCLYVDSREIQIAIKKRKDIDKIKQYEIFEIFNCLGNLKFKINVESLEKVKDHLWLERVCDHLSMIKSYISNPLSILTEQGQKLIEIVNQLKGYSLSDVSGPFPINDDTNKPKVVQCIALYQLCKLPDSEIVLQYNENGQIEDGARKMLSDIREYIKYFEYEINDDQDLNKEPYNFNKKIYIADQFNIYDEFYLHNIITFFSRINSVTEDLMTTYNNIINIKFCIPSILNILEEKIDAFKTGYDIIREIKEFLMNEGNYSLLEALLFLIVDDANNIMKVLKGFLIKYQKVEQCKLQDNQKPLKIHENLTVYGVKYQIENNIFMVKILYKQQDIGQEGANSVQESNLISRKQFLEMVFSSTEFLTDYFLDKAPISAQLMKLSQQLTKTLNMTINSTINYGSLYEFIDKYKQTCPVRQIDAFLSNLRRFIILSFSKYINAYLNSKNIKEKHSILMYNKFQSLDKQVSIQHIENESEFLYLPEENQQEPALTEIKALNDLKYGDEISIKNMYLIQIYKSYFASVVREGMTFIVGYKNHVKQPIAIRLKKKEDIDQVNIAEVGFLLLVTNSLPTNDQINHNRIIRIFSTDMNMNIYQVSKKVQNMLLALPEQSQDRNICYFVPSIQPNIIICFNSELAGTNCKKDDTQHKYFLLNLNNDHKFRLQPQHQPKINFKNYLKIDSAYRQLIDNFMNSVKSKHFNLKLKINVLPNAEKLTFFECLRYLIYDLESVLGSLILEPQRNEDLEAYVSIEKQVNVYQNYISARKLMYFNKFFEQIEVTPTSQGESKINIEGKTIQIILKIDKQAQKLNSSIIHQTIIKNFIQKTAEVVTQDGQYTYDKNDEKYMSILDHLSFGDIQFEVIKQSIDLFKKIKPDAPIKENYKITIDAVNKTKICVQGQQLHFIISSSNPYRTFFSQRQILSFFMNNNQQISENITITRFLPQEKILEVINYHQVCEIKLYLIDSGDVVCEETILSHDQKNNTRAYLPFERAEKFKKYYIIQNLGSVFQISTNYFPKPIQSQHIINEKTEKNKYLINQWVSMMLTSKEVINLNKVFLNYFIDSKVYSLTAQHDKIAVEVYLIDTRTLWVNLKSLVTSQIKFNFEGLELTNCPEIKHLSLKFISKNNMVIENTKFVEVVFRGKSKKVKNIEVQESDRNKIFKEPPEVSSIKLQEKKDEKRDVESMVYIVNQNAKKFLTRAGQKRIDVITLCDGDGNPVDPKIDELDIYFKHLNLSETIKPTVSEQMGNLNLQWQPTTRGQYEIFLNNIRLNPDYEMGVCAGCADLTKSSLTTPKKTKICFGEETEIMFQLKDSFDNIYTELEENIIGDKLMIDVIPSDENKTVKTRNQNINKYGFKKVKFWIDDPLGDEEKDISIEVLLNKQSMAKFDLHLAGQALHERMKKFTRSLPSGGYHLDISISRRNFFNDIVKLAQRSLKTNFSVKFVGEQGIDAGGVKRQFYDMIGSEFKKQFNPFFKCVNSSSNMYFLNPILLKNKKKKQYMELLGKYLANSIYNSYLIGVNFSTVFVKMLYKEEITYEDMFEVLPKEEADRYKYLLTAPADQFEDLSLYFSVVVDRKKQIEVELVEDGKQKMVTKENVEEYLSLMTKILIVDRFSELINDFRDGFEKVIPLQNVTKWIRADQFWGLTIGIRELTPEIVINYINFTGGSQMHHDWMRRYLKQANLQILEGFLKFASGSSSIDFYQTSKVSVRFEKSGNNPKKLPISHTCWKQIIIPAYKTYDIMKQLLNAAFLYCSEGFGFG